IGGTPTPTFLTVEEQFDDTGNDLQTFLKDRVLVQTNIESQTDTQITYLLKPDPTCRPLHSDAGGGPDAGADAGAGTIDQACADDLTKLEVRIVVTADGDGA